MADLESLSKQNAERRAACIDALQRLPIGMTADDIRAVVEREHPALMPEIIVAGARSIVASFRRPNPKPINFEQAAVRQRERASRLEEAAREVVRRVEIGGAVVEYLDKMMVGDKRLGDCAHADLLREEAGMRSRGKALLGQADLLRDIAACVGPNETVRTSGARSAILEVLRRHFGE